MKNHAKSKQRLPRGWTEKKIRAVIDYYDNQSEDEEAAEIEAAYEANGQTRLLVPTDLVPQIEALVDRNRKALKKRTQRRVRERSRS